MDYRSLVPIPSASYMLLNDTVYYEPTYFPSYVAVPAPEYRIVYPAYAVNPIRLNNNIVSGPLLGYNVAQNTLADLNVIRCSPVQEVQIVKKPCPLEMSIKAADLDNEIEDLNNLSPESEPDESTLDEPTLDEPTLHESTLDDPTLDETTLDDPTLDAPTLNKPILDVPTLDKPTLDVPTLDEPALDLPTLNDPTLDEPALDLPTLDVPTLDDLRLETPEDPTHDEPKTIYDEIDAVILEYSAIEDNMPKIQAAMDEFDISSYTNEAMNAPDIKEANNPNGMICEFVASEDGDNESSKPIVMKIKKMNKTDSENPGDERSINDEWERSRRKSRNRKRRNSSLSDDDSDWDSSDNEILAARCKKDVQFERCCPRLCFKRVQENYKYMAFEVFNELESIDQGDRYLGNCVQRCFESPLLESDTDFDLPPSPWPNYDEDEIANECNGNQLLSDEIQNAIRESLKDQESSRGETNEDSLSSALADKGIDLKNDINQTIWTYFIVVKSKQRCVCLKFLLHTLQIDASRIDNVKRRILNGDDLGVIPITFSNGYRYVIWDAASQHLQTLATKPVPYCRLQPPHVTLAEPIDQRTLFNRFCEYYRSITKLDIVPKFPNYRRFLMLHSNITFPRNNSSSCLACDKRTKWSLAKRRKEVVNAKPPKVKAKEKVKYKKKLARNRSQRGDVFSLMIAHLKSLPTRTPVGCTMDHKFFPLGTTIQSLYEDYRRYFLKLTTSELGLRYAIYESLFLRNNVFSIGPLDDNFSTCPKCVDVVENQQAGIVSNTFI